MKIKKMKNIIILFIALGCFAGCYTRHYWEKWISDGAVDVSGYENNLSVYLQILPTQYGITSGGPPHKINLRIIGSKNIKKINIITINITTNDGIKKNIKIDKIISFKNLIGVDLKADEHGIDHKFKELLRIGYRKKRKMKVMIKATLTFNNQERDVKIEKQFKSYKTEDKKKFSNPLLWS